MVWNFTVSTIDPNDSPEVVIALVTSDDCMRSWWRTVQINAVLPKRYPTPTPWIRRIVVEYQGRMYNQHGVRSQPHKTQCSNNNNHYPTACLCTPDRRVTYYSRITSHRYRTDIALMTSLRCILWVLEGDERLDKFDLKTYK